MKDRLEISYALDFAVRGRRDLNCQAAGRFGGSVMGSIPRIARLMALAIRLEGLIGNRTIPDCAEAARRGRVTRARITQIMQLLNLPPDLQEQILFLPPLPHVNERNLRPIVRRLNWHEQRRLFQELTSDGDRRRVLPREVGEHLPKASGASGWPRRAD
jgi:hypothetical protein